jgi:hypothetical protein
VHNLLFNLYFVMSGKGKRGRLSYDEVSAKLAEAEKLVASITPSKKSRNDFSWTEGLDASELALITQLDATIRMEISRNPDVSPDSLIQLCETTMKQ